MLLYSALYPDDIHSGGLWRTLDIDASLPVWQNVTDNSHLPGLGISDILVDPTNSNVIYIATGQQSFYGSYGVGVLKSTNVLSGNPQWNLTDLKYSPSVGEKVVVKKLLMHPTNNQIIYAITGTEVFQTTDGGATWPSLNLQGTVNSLNINLVGITFSPPNSDIIYVTAGVGEVWKGDASQTPTQWTNITSSLSIQQSAPVSYSISIIPNPSTGIFTLICQDDLQTIEVRDILGNIVFNKNINNQPVNLDVDITIHPPGIYFLKAQCAEKVYTEKVVVQ